MLITIKKLAQLSVKLNTKKNYIIIFGCKTVKLERLLFCNPGRLLFFFFCALIFYLSVILIITVISIVGLVSKTPADIDLVDDTPQYLALGVQYAFFKMTQGISGGFTHVADQHNTSYTSRNN